MTSPRTHFYMQGLTLMEILVVIAIVSILGASALPNFQPTLERWRVRQGVESLLSSLYLARSEALRQNGGIVLSTRNNPDDCKGWNCGWSIIAQPHNSPSETLLQRVAPAKNLTITPTMRGQNATSTLSFNQWGRAQGVSSAEFLLAPTSNDTRHAHVVCVLASGAIYSYRMGQGSCP